MAHGGDLIAEMLARYGVEQIFGQPGGRPLPSMTASYDARRALATRSRVMSAALPMRPTLTRASPASPASAT